MEKIKLQQKWLMKFCVWNWQTCRAKPQIAHEISFEIKSYYKKISKNLSYQLSFLKSFLHDFVNMFQTIYLKSDFNANKIRKVTYKYVW